MYLTRFLLDPRDRQARKELANRYELHRTLLSAFSDVPREEIGLLYRVELVSQEILRPIEVLVQTQIVPHWDTLDQAVHRALAVDVKEFNIDPKPGTAYYFRLEGNPTVRRITGAYSGKRVELRQLEEQSAWLGRKAARHGFGLLSLETTDRGKVISYKPGSEKRITITHQSVLYQGLLEVNDPDLFLDAVRSGIGGAKGFGFGLLSLAR